MSIEGTVRRLSPGTAYPCHGHECLEVEGQFGWPSLPLDWIAGEMVPDGARVRVTVEILDRNDDCVTLNWWHQNKSHSPKVCICKRHPGEDRISIEEANR